MLIRAKHFVTREPLEILMRDGRIMWIRPVGRVPGPVDLEGPWVAPALFDLQINGAMGIGFNSPDLTVDRIRTVCAVCRSHGIGGMLPTLVTTAPQAIDRALAALELARETHPDLARMIPGYHIEGPWISPHDGPRGAHPREHVALPDLDQFRRWQEIAGGRIRLLTLAPELAGAVPLIEAVAGTGVVVAIGHTEASPETIREAISAGAKLSTHLGNGSRAMLPRHPNHLWEQLAADELRASVISDGHHLPASVLKVFVRAKSLERLIVTCDASPLAGLPPGVYPTFDGSHEVLADGRVIVPGTTYLAGSGQFTDHCVSEMMRTTGIGLEEAIALATIRPCELLGLPIPEVAAGKTNPLMVFDWREGEPIRIVAVTP